MNSVSSRLKAIAITAAFFALSAFVLLAVVWGLASLPLPIPFAGDLASYNPRSSTDILSDLRLPTTLAATFLVALALVLAASSAYLDKMVAIFADVLLMLMAALAGFVAGYWVMLRLAGYDNFLQLSFLQSALVAPVIVFGVSLISPGWVRSSWPMRILVIAALLIAAPLMLVVLT